MNATLEEVVTQDAAQKGDKTRYAVVGTGGRVGMFTVPLARDYTEFGEIVGLCDISPTRMAYQQQRLVCNYGYHEVPLYPADEFERMLQETKADVVIVCTIDSLHHDYIIRALRAGCDVITEKPMTTDGDKCAAIFEAVRETGKNVRVTFNARWGPGPSKVRELLQSGIIGDVYAVNLEYQLDTSHGADYFRRWHAHKEYSGGLLVHKSTHHFDLVNWWTNSVPQEVFAWGGLNFYGRENALRRGDDKYTGYERYTGVPEAKDDPFSLTLDMDEATTALYRDAEEESGYLRDRNVFREGISSEDTMAVMVKYRTGVVLNYSLVAYSPQEGYHVTFTGDRGRIEYSEERSSHIIQSEDDKASSQEQIADCEARQILRVIPMFKPGYDVPIEAAEGSHGGADPLIQRQMFDPTAPEDKSGRNAGHEQGAASLLIGAAANASMETGLPVRLDDLCPLPAQASRLSELI